MNLRKKVQVGVAWVGLLAGAALAAQTQAVPSTTRTPQAPGASLPRPPRLVVFLVIDQFRSGYIDTYGSQWSHGLRRLLDTGAMFPLARYPYGDTVTCAGHSAIGTGVLPSRSGIIANSWYDRTQKKVVTCTEDPTVSSVAFGGGPGTEKHSPRAFMMPSFADELRLQARRAPQILSLSLKPRSAIGMAGHPGPNTTVIWEEDNGTWATSSAYASTPAPDVDAFARAHPLPAAYGQVWNRILPESRYLYEDDAIAEPSPAPFPHVLASRSGQADNAFVTLWERSPWSDAYLADLCISLVQTRRLGQQPGTDVLAISFSALDLVGHAFGSRSHEVQDVLARLDLKLGALFDTLDRTVGADRYVVALSADHGAPPIPEQAALLGMDTGRFSTTEMRLSLQAALVKVFGEGTYVANITTPNIYFAPDVFDRVLRNPAAIEAVQRTLMSVKGIGRVYWATDLASSTPTDDAELKSERMSYMAGRSGDLVFVPRPYWIAQATGSTHGTPYGYDQQVPLIFMGAGIRAGRYLVPASPLDIAPTFASLTGITLAHTDGQVRTEALVRRP